MFMSVILHSVVDGGVQALGQLGAVEIKRDLCGVGYFAAECRILRHGDHFLDALKRDLGLIQREGYGLCDGGLLSKRLLFAGVSWFPLWRRVGRWLGSGCWPGDDAQPIEFEVEVGHAVRSS